MGRREYIYQNLVNISTRKADLMKSTSIPSEITAMRIRTVSVASRRGREIPSYTTAHHHS